MERNDKNKILFLLDDKTIESQNINMYQYGSRVYECNDEESDYDIIIVKEDIGYSLPKLEFSCSLHCTKLESSCSNNLNGTSYDVTKFSEEILNHEISILECLFLPEDKIIVNNIKEEFNFDLSLSKLRHSVSAKASNSFVKCKKKLTVEEDFDPRVGKKSLFHSLRIILFGIQIAKYGKIVDYTEANKYWYDIVQNSSNDWEYYKKEFKPEYNKLMTEFRKLAPK